jgi:hypothetical protein
MVRAPSWALTFGANDLCLRLLLRISILGEDVSIK